MWEEIFLVISTRIEERERGRKIAVPEQMQPHLRLFCVTGLDVDAERQAVGSLFTVSLSPIEGAQSQGLGEKKGLLLVQHRDYPCLQTPAAGSWLTLETLYECISACEFVHVN